VRALVRSLAVCAARDDSGVVVQNIHAFSI
jgi:hypothetical protein